MFRKSSNDRNCEIIPGLMPDTWFRIEWQASCRTACTTYRAVENLASKAKNAGFSKRVVFERLKRDHCKYSSDKSIWAGIYEGWKGK